MYKIPFLFIRGSWSTISNICIGYLGELNQLFYIIFILGYIVTYGLLSVSLYQMATNRQMPQRWKAFIPFLRMTVLGDLADPVTFGKFTLKNSGLWAFILELVFFISGALELYIGGAFLVIYFIVAMIYYYVKIFIILGIFANYEGEKKKWVYTGLSVLSMEILFPIIIFFIKGRKKVEKKVEKTVENKVEKTVEKKIENKVEKKVEKKVAKKVISSLSPNETVEEFSLSTEENLTSDAISLEKPRLQLDRPTEEGERFHLDR